MNKLFRNTLTLLTASILYTACGGGQAYVQYHKGPSDGTGYDFVIPRTVIKVAVDGGSDTPAASQVATGARETPQPAKSKTATLSFTPVPVITDKQGVNLPVLNVTDDSGQYALVSTAITNVTYADYLIIQSIGTQITDNRKAAIDSVFGLIGIVASAVGFAARTQPICSSTPSLDNFEPFVITDIHDSKDVIPVPNNKCWGYQITELKDMGDMSVSSFPLKNDKGDLALPTDTKVSWFPYPSCKNYNISVFPCDPNESSLCKPFDGQKQYSAIVSVADGTSYRRIPLSPKGKVAMHTNFCAADVTGDAASLSSDWDLFNQAITDVKNLQSKQTSASKKGN